MSRSSNLSGDSTSFLRLQPAASRFQWSLPVTAEVAGATGTLHGGCGLAAAAAAMERTTDRPVSFIAGQYLARAPVGSEVMIEVDELAVGNRVTQAAAVCSCDGVVILRASAALGGHDLGVDKVCLNLLRFFLPKNALLGLQLQKVDTRLPTTPTSAWPGNPQATQLSTTGRASIVAWLHLQKLSLRWRISFRAE